MIPTKEAKAFIRGRDGATSFQSSSHRPLRLPHPFSSSSLQPLECSSMDPAAAPHRRPRRAAASKTRNYSEDLLDDLLLGQLGPVRKRQRNAADHQRETETEAMIALSLGFPIDALLDSELRSDVLPRPDDQNAYIVIRNHILARWRSSVRSFLSVDNVRETVEQRCAPLIASAYRFLSENGYINFGVSPALRPRLSDDHEGGSVIIIGAGLAGLAAARQLLGFGFRVLVLEGRDRPGGRVYTAKMGANGSAVAVDLGGSVITGIHANPLGVLARQLGIPLHKIREKCPLFRPDGGSVDEKLDQEMDLVFNKLLENASKIRELLGEFVQGVSLGSAIEKLRKLYNVARSRNERELLDWHLANLEYANAGCLSELSLLHWDQDDPYEMGGDHCFLAGGNWKLINALCEDVPVLYQKTVRRISYGESGVEVVVEGGQEFRADMVLCTVPLGVLKSSSIVFDPPLPDRKLEAIERLGFGLLNKVAMVFPSAFWGDDLDTFGCLNKERSKRGEFFLFYGYQAVSGGAVLIALVAGEAALEFEHTDPVVMLHRVLAVLRAIAKRRNIVVPDPIQTICTRWGSDPLCHGSYSHVRVGSSGDDYDILAENVNERLFFAGEATTRQYPATMHGAFLSGLREAACILHASRSRMFVNEDAKACSQKNLKLCGDLLAELFRDPDLAFGNVSFVFDALSMENPKAMGLMKVTLNNCMKNCSGNGLMEKNQSTDRELETLQLYAILSLEQACQMQTMSEDDKSRLSLACKKFDLKLMGFSSTCAVGNSLITSISNGRKGRNRHRQSGLKNHGLKNVPIQNGSSFMPTNSLVKP
ncbi:Spermine oxidase protein [Dioscorea alata]|uniref:Spermine oxidase protein n=1 Tax=Dioscorea alata TaxID=55571 RepID=A0ACB7U3F2_DIOAL|nr:Spermine oxidase protein [Dioscorea alata]